MPDYKKMYLNLFKASEEAVNLLIAAQRECEELYISAPEPDITPLPATESCTQKYSKKPSHPKG